VSPARITPCFRHLIFFGSLLVVPATVTSSVLAQDQSSASPISVTGQVINAATGAGIPRVLIKLGSRAVLTDHEGKFRFDQFIGTSGNLEATKPGFYFSADPADGSSLSLQSAQLAEPIQLRLYPEALLTGTVTAPDGEPLQHVPVIARRSIFDETTRRWVPVAQSQTDSHGNFRLPVPPGDYKIETRYMAQDKSEIVLPITFPGEIQSNSSSVIHAGSGEETHFDLHPAMGRAYTVTARLDSPPGRGFPGITARSSTGSMIPVDFQRTAKENEGKLQLPSGTYTLMANMFGPEGRQVQGETMVTVPDHDVSGVVLRLAPNPSIPVELEIDSSVTSDNSTPPNIQQLGLMMLTTDIDTDRGNGMVMLEISRRGIPNFTVAPGTYRLQARAHGSWYVKSMSYGDSDLLNQDIAVAPGAGGTPIRVTVSNQTGSLQGTVKLNGTPAACWIYLIPSFPSALPFFALRSGSNGVYNEANLPPGNYQAIAFEHRHSADYRDPNTLAAFTTHVRSIEVNEGDKPNLDLDAVTTEEVVP
jgi:hypothetical protein